MTNHLGTALDREFDRLADVFRSSAFLEMLGTSNEVPLFIKPYAPESHNDVDVKITGLIARLRNAGLSVLEIELLSFVREILNREQRLDRLLEKESTTPRGKMLRTMARWTDPKTVLVPAIAAKFAETRYDLTIIHGVGAVFPFLRTHSILENLQPAMMKHPVVMFFPGRYQHREGHGSSLHLFGRLEHRGYYRAFNLDDYHI